MNRAVKFDVYDRHSERGINDSARMTTMDRGFVTEMVKSVLQYARDMESTMVWTYPLATMQDILTKKYGFQIVEPQCNESKRILFAMKSEDLLYQDLEVKDVMQKCGHGLVYFDVENLCPHPSLHKKRRYLT